MLKSGLFSFPTLKIAALALGVGTRNIHIPKRAGFVHSNRASRLPAARAPQWQTIRYAKAEMAAQDSVCACPTDAEGNVLPFPPLRYAYRLYILRRSLPPPSRNLNYRNNSYPFLFFLLFIAQAMSKFF